MSISRAAIWIVAFLMALAAAASARLALADDFTSTDFKVLHPVIFSAGYSASTDYQLWSTFAQPAVGTSSATDFQVRSGFLYFDAPAAASAAAAAVSTPASEGGGVLESFLKAFSLVPPPLFAPSRLGTIDLNGDGKVDLRDLSVFLFLTPRPLPNPADFNNDQRVDLRDLSVFLSGWTGHLFVAPEESPRAARGAISGEKRARTGFAFAGQKSLISEAATTQEIGQRPQNTQQIKRIVQAASSVVRRTRESIARTMTSVSSSLRPLWQMVYFKRRSVVE